MASQAAIDTEQARAKTQEATLSAETTKKVADAKTLLTADLATQKKAVHAMIECAASKFALYRAAYLHFLPPSRHFALPMLRSQSILAGTRCHCWA